MYLLLTTKAPSFPPLPFLPSLSSPPLPSPPLSACLHINCDMQVAKGHAWARNMHDLGLSEIFLRLYLKANWRAKGAVLFITFFCIIYRYFWLSMLVPSSFTCSCTPVLLLSTVQQQQANLMILLQRAKKVVSDSLRLVDFAIGPVNSVFNLLDGQVMFYKEFK